MTYFYRKPLGEKTPQQLKAQEELKRRQDDFFFADRHQIAIESQNLDRIEPKSVYYIRVRSEQAALLVENWFLSYGKVSPFEGYEYGEEVGYWARCSTPENEWCRLDKLVEELTEALNNLIEQDVY